MSQNLPVSPTAFVGRQQDIQAIIDQLTHSPNQILTITGMGGVGKTRLGIQIGYYFERQQHPFDGVFFIPLAPITHSQDILITTMTAMGLTPSSSKNELITYINEHRPLLIFDNFEHVMEGASLLDDLITHCPQLCILATSREKLRLKHEVTYSLKGLSTKKHLDFDKAVKLESVQLFCQIAEKVNWNFRMTDQNIGQILEICQRVNGIPLAIELSAAWLRMMSIDKILEQLESSSRILADSLHHVPERHRSIRAVFETSWQLLTEEEQIIYSQLSVFRGGFTQQAIEEMLGASPQQILSFVDKSLIQQHEDNRYAIHELLREYAEDKLGDFPQYNHTIQHRHAQYFATFLERCFPKLSIDGTKQSEVVQEINAEFDNIRKMWYFALSQFDFQFIEQSVETIYYVNQIHGTYLVAFQMFEDVQHKIEHHQLQATHPQLYTQILSMMAFYAALSNLYDQIVPLAEKATQLAQQYDLSIEHARAETALSVHWATIGDLQKAKYHGELAVELYSSEDNIEEQTNAYLNLGWIYQLLGDFSSAERLFIRLVAEKEARGHIYQAAQGNIWLALLNNLQGKYRPAKSYGLKALSQFESLGGKAYTIATRKNLGASYWGLGDYTESRRYFFEALDFFVNTHYSHRSGMLSAMAWMIYLIHSEGDSPFAVEVAEFVLNHPDTNHETRELINDFYPTLQEGLLDMVLEAARDRGQFTTLHQMADRLYQYFDPNSSTAPEHPIHIPKSISHIIHETLDTGLIPDYVTDQSSREFIESVVFEIQKTLQTEKSRMVSKLVESASHDLRNPITIINSSLYLLEHIKDSDQQKDKLNKVKNQVEHLHDIIESLLLMARLDSGASFEFQEVNLVPLVRSTCIQISPIAEQLKLNIETSLPTSPINVVADVDNLQHAIKNILDNAFHHTPSNGTITVSCKILDSKAVIYIQDTGEGIAQQHIPYIFDRFYRVDTSRTSLGKAGLGLAIVKQIVESHHGVCRVTSKIGEGSTFSIHLPLA